MEMVVIELTQFDLINYVMPFLLPETIQSAENLTHNYRNNSNANCCDHPMNISIFLHNIWNKKCTSLRARHIYYNNGFYMRNRRNKNRTRARKCGQLLELNTQFHAAEKEIAYLLSTLMHWNWNGTRIEFDFWIIITLKPIDGSTDLIHDKPLIELM